MATRRCCSGCSGSNNCYGALGCVPGPYNYRNYPYYTGPCAQAGCTDGCGNTAGCGCNNGCGNGCNHHHHHRPPFCPPWVWEEGNIYPPVLPDPNPPTPSIPPQPWPGAGVTQAYGFFTAEPPLTVAAGGIVPLTTGLANNQFFANSGGSITIRRAGVYLISYTVHLEGEEAVNSQLYLTLNGTAVDTSGVNISTTASDTDTNSYTAQLILQVPANSTLTLNTSDALSFDATDINPVNMTVVRLA